MGFSTHAFLPTHLCLLPAALPCSEENVVLLIMLRKTILNAESWNDLQFRAKFVSFFHF